MKLRANCYTIACFCLLSANALWAQVTNKNTKNYFVGEVFAGKIVPNYLNYPKSSARIGLGITYYFQPQDTLDPVVRYYKKPSFGIHFGAHRLGNPNLFGNQLDLLPVLNLPTKKGSFQFGLGIAYFTKTYKDNIENRVVGSQFTWSFQSIYYKNFNFNEDKNLRLGFGYLHGSNGHTQLPNFGINSAVLIFGITPKENGFIPQIANQETPYSWYLQSTVGIGYHEFGGTSSPIGGPKKAVYSASAQAGVQFKGQFRWFAGFGARHYQHYADSIKQSPVLQDLKVTAKNYYFITGIEYLIYHVGISIDGGINIYKPFFKHFSKQYETVGNWQYKTKKLFISRVGIKFYLINTAKKPKHNIYIAPYLNANFGQADFSELCVGYVYKLK